MSLRLRHFCTSVTLLYWLFGAAFAVAELKSTTIARYDVAVEKAVSFLQSMQSITERDRALVAYALLKAGVESTEPLVIEGIELAQQRANVASYGRYEESYVAAVDAMLLAAVDAEKYRKELQNISNLIVSYQRSDGSWYDPGVPNAPGDVSLTQYCILALWAAQRSGCRVPPRAFDKTAQYLIDHSNRDGGWTYRITGPTGEGTGRSIHTMTMAGVGTIGIARLLLTSHQKVGKKEMRFGDLERVPAKKKSISYPNYQAKTQPEEMDTSIAKGLAWHRARFAAVPPARHLLYFYYALERAAALTEFQEDWYTVYGDGLLSLQAADGHFDGLSPTYGSAVGTSFAILYYMRSTQQILNYGKGVQVGSRDLVAFLHPKSNVQKEIGPLDDLLAAMEGKDFSELDVNTDEVVEKVQFSSREELIGQADKLKRLLKSPDATNRQIAYWALSRTGDFDLVPLLLDGLSDPVLSVNVEALIGLRYISKQPSGFSLSLKPLSHLPDDANEEKRISAAAVWRAKASRLWRKWYSNVRPYAERDGLDEIGLPVD